MNRFSGLLSLGLGALAAAGATTCSSSTDTSGSQTLSASTVLDLKKLKVEPAGYEWFDFRPNVKKLILAGKAETEHVAILWYTVSDGAVGLHYHGKTESVYVIDGSQTDAKGVYPTETVYFNPPGSGHEIMKSSGFFILAYASPPDFAKTNLIGAYTPVRIDTNAPDLSTALAFVDNKPGVRVYTVPLDAGGGMSAELVELKAAASHGVKGNYLLVLAGTCEVAGTSFSEDTLIVPKTTVPQAFTVAAPKTGTCLAMNVSF